MNYYDTRTIGRYPARQPKANNNGWGNDGDGYIVEADDNIAYFFDGKAFTPISNAADHRGSLGAFTGYGQAYASNRRSALRHADLDYALAYTQCEYAFRCINTIADDIGGLRFMVRNKATQQDAPDHTLMEAIRNARIIYMQNIMTLWQKSLRVFGETYIEPTRDVFGRIAGARWLNPIVVEPIIMSDKLDRFDYTGGGKPFSFKPWELVYDKIDSLLDDIRGQSLIGVALDAINIDREIKRYTLENFLKDMKMSGILTGRQGTAINDEDLKTARNKLLEQRGARIVAIAPALEYQQVQQAMDATQFQVSEDVRRRVCAALGIPISVAGAWDDAKYQSAPAQQKFYAENVLLREVTRLTEVIADRLMPFYDNSGEYEAYFDVTGLMALLEDRQVETSLVNSRLTSGAITINEAREKLGDKPLPGGDVLLIPASVVLIAKDNIQPTPAPVAPPPGTPALPAPGAVAALPAGPVAVPADGTKDAGSLCIMLSLSNNPDLMSLQGRVKEYVGDIQTVWNEPDSYHVTLLVAPVVDDLQAAQIQKALEAVEIPQMSLPIGSLGVFDNVGEYPVHFRIRRNVDLLDLQAEVYELVAGLGVPVSSFSDPANYKPHITMGYASEKPKGVTFNSKLKVTPTALVAAKGDLTLYRKDLTLEAVKTAPADMHSHLPPPAPQGDPLDELAAWRKKVTNKGDVTAPFKTYLIRENVATELREGLTQAAGDPAAIKAVFDDFKERLSIKAIQATRLDFENAFDDVLAEARAGSLTRTRWGSITRQLIRTYGARAFRDGLKDGGVDDNPDEADQEVIAGLIADQSQYVTNLGKVLFKDENGLTDALADQKASLWYSGSILPFYSAGVLSADKNGMYEWVLGNNENHCNDCPNLDGKRQRYKTWYRQNLIAGSAGQDTECSGWLCECKLVRSAGKSTSIEAAGELAA